MVSLAGRTLGKYRLIEQLGRGGFATVYKAYHARLDRYVAVKVLHPYLVEGEDFLARFEREARAVATLRHPNIVMVHDFDVEDNIYYMVMEFIEGQSLKTRLEDLNSSGLFMSLAEIRRILGDLTRALDYAHNQGMLHRDIKPSNVVLNTEGEAFLTDFGIARILSSTQFTATGALIGTPAYMSPEQGQGLGVSPASDVYSLGVMYYEFLTGRVPFDADTPLAIIFKHIRDPLPSIRKIRSDLSEDFERVVYKALAKDPEDRFQSPGELMVVLEEALANLNLSEMDIHPQIADSPSKDVDFIAKADGFRAVDLPGESDFDNAKAPTVAVDRERDLPPVGPIVSDRELEYDKNEKEPQPSKPSLLPADDALFEEPVETLASDYEPLPRLATAEYESDAGPTIPIRPENSLEAVESNYPAEQVVADHIPGSPPVIKKRNPVKLFMAVGIPLVGVIILGIVLFNLFSPGTGGELPQAAVIPTTRPTKVSLPTLPPEPTEIPGLVQFEQGMALLHEKGNYTEAINKFNQAEELGFSKPELFANRAWACHENQYYNGECNYEIALRDYSRAIELDPNRAGYYADRAWTFIHIEQWGEALKDYTRAIELEPDNPDYWNARGDAYSKIGELEAAVADFSHAIDLNPIEPNYHSALATAFTNAGDLEAAIAEYTVAIELDPENPKFWIARGWRHLESNHLEGAMLDFNQAIALAPESIRAYVGRATTNARLENYDAAIADMDAVVEMAPDDDRLYIERAHILWWQLDDFDAAIRDLTKAIEINPENWEAYLNLGEIFAYEFEDIDQGLDFMNQAVAKTPRDIDVSLFVRGVFFQHIENWESSANDFTMALRISPENPDGYGHRGYAYQMLGKKDEAREDYRRFLELSAGKPEYEVWRADVETWLNENP